MYCTAISQIADKRDCQAVDCTQFLANSEEIEERLSRMFYTAVSAVNDRHRRYTSCSLCAVRGGMTHHNSIAIARECADCVSQRFAFRDARSACCDRNDFPTQSLHRSFERR